MRMTVESIRQQLRCPHCRSPLAAAGEFRCTNDDCARLYPVVGGVPIVIDEERSVFTFAEFTEKRRTFFAPTDDPRRFRDTLARLLYENSTDLKSSALIARFTELVSARSAAPRVLVVGAGTGAEALAPLRDHSSIAVLETDVSLAGGTTIVCDCHDLPFDDGAFDGVIAQAVLEHVADPQRCAAEIHRVLAGGGVVFSDTPFMQQVHGGRYDFTRFTHLGHRRLFRRFEEIESGASAGPGVALSWSYQYFLLSLATSRTATRLLRVFAKATSFWWKYLDRWLIERPAALDAASATYFLGRKSDQLLSDRALVESYRGANGRP